MKHKIFTFHDSKAEAYLPIFQAPTEGIAQRSFTDLVNQKGHQFNMHPEDYNLVLIGEFDDVTGFVEKHEQKALGLGLQFVKNPDT